MDEKFKLPIIKGEKDANDFEAKYAGSKKDFHDDGTNSERTLLLPNGRAIDEFGGQKYTNYSKYEPGEYAKDYDYSDIQKLIDGKADLAEVARTAIKNIKEQIKILHKALELEGKYPSGNDKVKPDLEAKIAKLENDFKQFGISSNETKPDTNPTAEDKSTDTDSQLYGPKTKEQAIADGEYTDTSDDPTLVSGTTPGVVPLIDTEVHSGNPENVTPLEEMPENPAERPSWFRRNRNRIIGGVAALAIFAGGIGTGLLLDRDKKDNQRSGSDEKTEQPAKQNPSGTSHDDFMKQFKVNQAFPHPDNQTGPGFEKGDSTKQASEQLKKNFDHHPTLLAEAVYAYQHGIGVDEARAHVNEINSMTKSFTNGDYLSAEGQKWAMKLGKSVDNGSARWVTQDEMNSGIWYNSGIEENGNFDKFFINPNAGFNANKILRVTLGNGKVIYLKGNCENFLWKDTLESTSTSNGSVNFTPTTVNERTIRVNPTNPQHNPTQPHGHTLKGAPYGADGELKGLDPLESHQNPGGGNLTNVDTNTSPGAIRNGSGSSETAPGADPLPDRDPSTAQPVPGAGSPSDNTTDPGKPK